MRADRQLGAVLFGTGADDVARRRTVFFAATVVVLLTTARKGVPTLVFGLALSVYLVAAGLWLRGQYTRHLAGRARPEQRWRRLSYLGIFAVALALGGLYALLLRAERPVGGLLLAALVLGYFAIGGALDVWRSGERRFGAVGTVLGVLAVASVLAGYYVLRGEDTHQLRLGVGLLGFGLLVCWPLAVAAISERGTRFFAEPPSGSTALSLLAVAVGLGGAVGVAVWTYVGSRSTFTLLLVVALAVLTASVASNTRADIVLVIAGLAVMGFTPGDGGDPRPVADKEHVLVALGDSYMSGEGASIYFKDTDSAGKDTCRRAPSAWSVQAGQRPPFDGTLILACSGAVSANIRATDPDGSALPHTFSQTGEDGTQLQQYAARLAAERFEPELVVMSIGGNDAGFSTIGVMCLVPGNCEDKGFWWTDGLADVRTSLDETFTQVREAFDGVPVVVTAYPDPIYRGAGDRPPPTAGTKLKDCSQVALRPEERAFIAFFLERLNSTVQEVARAHGFYYLTEMKDSLKDAGLQLCDPANHGRPGLNFIGLRSVSGLAEQRFNPANWSHNSLHPNERGHQAMLQTFERWLAAHPDLQEVAPDESGGAPTVVPAGDGHPVRGFTAVCSPLDPNPSGCRSRGTHWAVEETSDALVHSGRAAQVVFIEAFWWLAVLGFFGWRRRAWSATDPVHMV